MTGRQSASPMEFRRGSGILLHITSLPSAYGIGDLGPEAARFAEFLADAGQRVWQVLPLNPTDPYYGNSPYSSISASAGNTLLVSPDLLIEDGLLSARDLEPMPRFPDARCDFSAAALFKDRLLDTASRNFRKKGKKREDFEAFCRQHAGWLDDFALFTVIKTGLGGLSWDRWPEDLRDRRPHALETVKLDHSVEIENVKLRQYLFFDQWRRLKAFCTAKGILLFGDLAIYVNYDSSDVWAHPGIFKLDDQRQPVAVSGVPPDYFSATGQLWGNPVYDWDAIREDGFSWWISRMEHYLGLFDILRIDHFRGLVSY